MHLTYNANNERIIIKKSYDQIYKSYTLSFRPKNVLK